MGLPAEPLLNLLRQDLADVEKTRFTDEVLFRCIQRGTYRVSRDLGIGFTYSGGETPEINPEPSQEHEDLIILAAAISACQHKRSETADAFQFRSADKEVDKTSIPKQWADLEKALQSRYQEAIKRLNPAAADEGIMRPTAIGSIYEQGVCYDHKPDDIEREKHGDCGYY